MRMFYKNHNIWIGMVCFFLFTVNNYADVKLPFVFADNMILQREIEVPVWGWADEGEDITVTFAGQTVKAKAEPDGKWMLKLKAIPANTKAQDFTVTGKNMIKLSNVLVGDVWICSGQSNMAFGVKGCLNRDEEIKNANYPMIRQINVSANYNIWPIEKVFNGRWYECSSTNVGSFKATAYFFAREVFKETGIPIGLISTNWGGTKIEPWTPFEGFRRIPELKDFYNDLKETYPTTPEGKIKFDEYVENMKKWITASKEVINKGNLPQLPPNLPGTISGKGDQQKPTFLYNAMVNPIKPYAIKGALWYQGEANGVEGDSYFYKMKALIEGWREVWGQGEFPFYYVQLPNFTKVIKDPEGGKGWARIREAQAKALSIPNTGMAITIDIGEERNIHPKNKQDVGKRLAALALSRLYGKDVVSSGPLYKEQKIEGNKIRISFDYAKGGLMAGTKNKLDPVKEVSANQIDWFAIAGKDKKWYWAKAKIEGETVVVSSDKVSAPVAVRYAFTPNPEGAKLYNKAGIPASPFRTDNW